MKKPFVFLVAAVLLLGLPARDQDVWGGGLSKIRSIMNILEADYYKDLDEQKLGFAAVRGLLDTLDPHSYFLDPESLSRMREDYTGKFFGLGIQIQKQDDRIAVVAVVEGAPAWRLGVQIGDVISAIDGESTKPLTSFDAMQKLRGARGTKVTITIVRDGMEKPFDLTVIREEIPLLSVPYAFILEPGVGYIYIRNFAETTPDELEEKLRQLSGQGMRSLILDLRGNGGGPLTQCVEVADLFLPKDTLVVSMKGRNRVYDREFRASRDGQYETLPLVVLINQGTASASEIVAGAVEDHDRGLVIGEDSWGKGLVQTVFPLAPTMAVALTTAKYLTPSGRSIQRDFSHLEDYYMAKRGPEDTRETRYTDKGRKVLGGGGISPDYKVEWDIKPLTGRMLLNGAFFIYTRRLLRHQTGLAGRYSFPEDRTAGAVDAGQAGRIVVDKTLAVDAAVLDDFRAYARSLKIEFTDADFAAAADEIRRELEREIASALGTLEEGTRVYRKTDPVVLKALEVMPEAAKFVE
jgi:carboxyl-terminal processing protease